MAKALIIVESPAKIKTLQKILGPDYLFESSLGHVRDLPASDFGIDTDNDFAPKYEILPDKQKLITQLRKAARSVDVVYLAPDPDREGEAIAWHISEVLAKKTNFKRISFNSITKEAVRDALTKPREIDQALVNAQQARRLLDRIVGYTISPILARKVQRRGQGSVSAGRVQSVALKLVVDREHAIEKFNPVEYWNIAAWLQASLDTQIFKSQLYSVDGRKIEKEGDPDNMKILLVDNEDYAKEIVARLEGADYIVKRVDKKEKRRNPVPSFITSTLQQEASRYYGFSSARTMSIAQTLYEGVEIGQDGAEGIITYIRTDSVRVAPEALSEARRYIKEKFTPEFLPEKPRIFSTKKSAQDAHEAIRPTDVFNTPEILKPHLSLDQYRLYLLIWRRFLATQMMPAVYDTISADVAADENIILRTTGSIIKFQGFLAIYEEKQDEEDSSSDSKILPELIEGQTLYKNNITSDQSFTKPPPRFTEASLVKELEKSGIGRPSTYAAIMNKIHGREYTVKEGKAIKPTELGKIIAQMLEDNFQQIMNTDFTAHMEDDLELIAADKKNWIELIREFWTEFVPIAEKAKKEAVVPRLITDLDCPTCGAKLQKIWAGDKYFYGCINYPECKYTASIDEFEFDKDDYAENFDWDQTCSLCQSKMILRHGRFGAFLGCSTYPDCKGIVNIPKKGEDIIDPKDLPACPAVGCEGNIVARKSRFGKTFFSCSSFPDCNVIVNDLDDLYTKYVNYPKTAHVKKKKTKTTKKKKTTRTKKERPPVKISPDLAVIIGQDTIPRTQIMKKAWEYIKKHDLQNKDNKKIIEPDDNLAKVFGHNEPINMFKLVGLLNKHII
jgi:DNA topoisomerase I